MSDSANALLHSRKFLLALTDAVASTVLLLATRFLSPSDVDLVRQIVIIYQPVIIAVIAGIAVEDAAAHAATAKADAMVRVAEIHATGVVPHNVMQEENKGVI